jgi:hypothetical protein
MEIGVTFVPPFHTLIDPPRLLSTREVDLPHSTPSCRRCASRQVVLLTDAPGGSQYRCENCGREWTSVERFIERRRDPDRRRTTRGDRRRKP